MYNTVAENCPPRANIAFQKNQKCLVKYPLLTRELSIPQEGGAAELYSHWFGAAPGDVSGPGRMLQHLQGNLQIPRSLLIRFRPRKLTTSIASTRFICACAPKTFVPHPQNMRKYAVGTRAFEPNHSRSPALSVLSNCHRVLPGTLSPGPQPRNKQIKSVSPTPT